MRDAIRSSRVVGAPRRRARPAVGTAGRERPAANGEPARANVLGIGVSAIDLEEALGRIEGWVRRREPHYVCVTGVHGVMESQRDPVLRRIHNEAGLVTPDGMPLVWMSRFAGFRHVQRVYGPDLLLHCCARLRRIGCRHFFYGGAEGVPERLVYRLGLRFPGLSVAGVLSPPFRPLSRLEDDEIVRRINEARPDIVWVGLSTPKQERWMADHRHRLSAPVLIGVGAAFDFHAGVKPQAPLWLRPTGLEWVYRMLSEPRRLAPRYLVNNPAFVWQVLLQSVGLRKYAL